VTDAHCRDPHSTGPVGYFVVPNQLPAASYTVEQAAGLEAEKSAGIGAVQEWGGTEDCSPPREQLDDEKS